MSDWELRKKDFEADGSLRDIYVLWTSTEDWWKVLDFIRGGPYRATFASEGGHVASMADLSAVFGGSKERPALTFWIWDVGVCCHFFSAEEIEFDFAPDGLTQERLDEMLRFIRDLGRLTGKPVHLTPENARDVPIFRYAPERDEVTYVPTE